MAEIEQGTQGETKEARFVRLATKRTQTALGKISLIGNLAAPNYRFTEEQVQKVLSTLREAVDEVERRFHKQGDKTKRSFTL